MFFYSYGSFYSSKRKIVLLQTAKNGKYLWHFCWCVLTSAVFLHNKWEKYFDIWMLFLVLTEIWQPTLTTSRTRSVSTNRWPSLCKSDNLCPFNKIMIIMFSCVQYKTMEQWTVYFGSKTLYKGPSMFSSAKSYL